VHLLSARRVARGIDAKGFTSAHTGDRGVGRKPLPVPAIGS